MDPTSVDIALGADDLLGESPYWAADTGTLLRVDIEAGVVRTWAPSTGDTTERRLGDRVSAAIPTTTGGLVAAVDERVVVLDDVAGTVIAGVIAEVEPDVDGTRANDAACDPTGRLWIGTYALDGSPRCGLYRIHHDGTSETVLTGLRASNGMGWTADGHVAYVVDTGAQRVLRLNLDDRGMPADVHEWVHTGDEGVPDGLAVDTDGGVWVAMFGGARLVRYDAAGHESAVVPLPVTYPTSVAFGGADLDTLYITTSQHRLDPQARAAEPAAGSVLACSPGVHGVATSPFGAAL